MQQEQFIYSLEEDLRYKLWQAENLWYNQCLTLHKRWVYLVDQVHKDHNDQKGEDPLTLRKVKQFRAHSHHLQKRHNYVTNRAKWELSLLATLQERLIIA